MVKVRKRGEQIRQFILENISFHNFEGVNSIGQAFADEIFRVFRSKNRNTEIHHINANRDVEDMIVRALIDN